MNDFSCVLVEFDVAHLGPWPPPVKANVDFHSEAYVMCVTCSSEPHLAVGQVTVNTLKRTGHRDSLKGYRILDLPNFHFET